MAADTVNEIIEESKLHPPDIPGLIHSFPLSSFSSLMSRSRNLIHVNQINWASKEISRSGIIPIYDDGLHKWIGLGVSKFSGNITTIGGRWEPTDHDLLTTAIREYNEEVGSNMENLVEESVYDCYAIQSTYSIAIFYPIKAIPDKDFVPTDELFDLIWVTSEQLRIMATKQEFVLKQYSGKKTKKSSSETPKRKVIKSTTRAFLFSNDLKLLANSIVWTIETGIPFIRPKFDYHFYRPKRVLSVTKPQICFDITTFIRDCQNHPNWGNVSLVMMGSQIGLMRYDQNVYILPLVHLDLITMHLNRLNIKIYVGLRNDLIKLKLQECGLNQRIISSIEYGLIRLQNTYEVLKEFIGLLQTIRNNEIDDTSKILTELSLILSYESRVYRLVEEQGGFFNEKRAYFLKGLSKINRILAQNYEGMPYLKLKSILLHDCPKIIKFIAPSSEILEISTSPNDQIGPPFSIYHLVINIMIMTGLIKQKRQNSDVYIYNP
jgi:8-oxo-dGTP pyrophosphatase MutT (NUDIX family)